MIRSDPTVNDHCLHRQAVAKTASIDKAASGISIFLLEELGDARMRCAQLKKYIDEAVTLIEKSEHKDHFFEVGAHLLHGIPDTLIRMDKALSAAAMAAAKLDYEEIKDDLRPEKVEELEKALEDVRVRRVQRRSEETTMNTKEASAWLERLAAEAEHRGKVNPIALMTLITRLEGIPKEASRSEIPTVLRELAQGIISNEHPSRLHLATVLRRVLADSMELSAVQIAAGIYSTAGSREDVINGFRESNPSMTDAQLEEAADQWEKNKDVVKDKQSNTLADQLVESRYEEGKPADPIENMSPEDAKEWKQNTEEHKDEFKSASVSDTIVLINIGQHSVGVVVVGPDARMIQSAESELKQAAEDAGASIEDEHPRDIPHLDRESSYSGFTAEDEPEYLSDLVEAIKKAAKRVNWISDIQVAHGHWPKIASAASDPEFKTAAGDIEYVIWGVPPGEQHENVLYTRAESMPEARKVIHTLETKHGCTKCRIQVLDLTKAPDFSSKKLFKSASMPDTVLADEAKRSRFEEGKPADPTENMDPEDAKKWKQQTDEHKDEFKTAKHFPTQEALQKYLKDHPDAKKSEHSVTNKSIVPKRYDRQYAAATNPWKI
jgi:hypothetical protein